MDPKEIFELIVKADEKLKYATTGQRGPPTAAGPGALRAGEGRGRGDRQPGLVQQAETRLADLGEA